jgi:hypothetical protein
LAIELNRSVFKRLVHLSLLLLATSMGLAIYEVVDPSWSAFSADFDEIVARHFGSMENMGAASEIALTVLLIVLVAWILASLLGSLRFKRWARPGLWMPVAIFVALGFVIPGWYPSFTTPLYDLLNLVDSAVMGAITLLAYSSEHGDRWFNGAPTTDTEV